MRTNHLLVIGIDKYQNDIAPLYNAVKDAKAFRDLMVEQYQFKSHNVIELYDADANKDAILSVFDDLLESLTEEDNLVIYYSGHGEHHELTQTGYWIPVDARLENRGSYLENDAVKKFFKHLKAFHIFGIVDSCFSGVLFRKMGSSLQRLDNFESRWLLTAGRNEPVLDGSLGDHSPFAKSLLSYLRNHTAEYVMAADVCQRVLEGVLGNTDVQTPRGEPMQNVGHQGGQFVFYKKGVTVPAFEQKGKINAGDTARTTKPTETTTKTTEPTKTNTMSLETLKGDWKLLLQTEIEEGFDILRTQINPASRKYNDIILLLGQYNSGKKDIDMGYGDPRDFTRTRNRIRASLVSIVDDLKEQDLKAEHRPNTAQTTNSNNTSNSTTGGGGNSQLKQLTQMKLDFLKQQSVLATDASVKFKLQIEIQELEQQLKSLS